MEDHTVLWWTLSFFITMLCLQTCSTEYRIIEACKNEVNKAHLQLACEVGDVVIGSVSGAISLNDTCIYNPDDCLEEIPLSNVDHESKCFWRERSCSITGRTSLMLVPSGACSSRRKFFWDYLVANYSCISAKSVHDICNKSSNFRISEEPSYIISPNYPQTYGNNLDCIKKIASDPGYGIRIKAESVDLPEQCSETYIAVLPEYVSGTKQTYCKQFDQMIPHNEVTLRFIAPSLNEKFYTGFVLHVSAYRLPTTTTYMNTGELRTSTVPANDSLELEGTTKEPSRSNDDKMFFTNRNIMIFCAAGGSVIVLILIIALVVETYKRRCTGQMEFTDDNKSNFQ